MKRIILLVLLILLAAPAIAEAEPLEPVAVPAEPFVLKVVEIVTPTVVVAVEPVDEPVEPPPKPAAIVYTVVKGDNLTKIGAAHNVEWQRLWAKNTQLTHPDVIHVGDQITIPFPDEVLARDLPPSVMPESTPGVTPLLNYAGGNTYDYGYCTWYVKNRRGASLPNGLGNANTWYSRAAGMGMAVGSEPRASAVGTTTRGSLGHVVYVESVNADGSINISEMNYEGFAITSHRTASASEFVYIY